jgi:hypothetical protein
MKTLSKPILTLTAAAFVLAAALPLVAVSVASADPVAHPTAPTRVAEACETGCTIVVKSPAAETPAAVFTVIR